MGKKVRALGEGGWTKAWSVRRVVPPAVDAGTRALFPDALKKRDLKLAVAFNYTTFSFAVWLAARNRQVQRRYWELLLNTGYKKYPLIEPAAGIDAIVEVVIAADYSLEAENNLTAHIIEGVTAFEHGIVAFLDEVDVRQSS
jgi:hypothetical protein